MTPDGCAMAFCATIGCTAFEYESGACNGFWLNDLCVANFSEGWVGGTGAIDTYVLSTPFCTSHSDCTSGKYCHHDGRCLGCGSITPDFCEPRSECDGCISPSCCTDVGLLANCPTEAWPMLAKRCPSAENCRSIADGIQLNDCGMPSAQQLSMTCNLDCAERWLKSLRICEGHRGAFEGGPFAAQLRDLTATCNETVRQTLAPAAKRITLSGLQCHPYANANYFLQALTLNGKPLYSSLDGTVHIYWGSSHQRWLIDNDLDDGSYYHAYISSEDFTPPTGRHPTSWKEHCGGSFQNSETISIAESLSPTNCVGEAERLLDLLECNSVVALRLHASAVACPVDCADIWLRGAVRCSVQQQAFERAAPANFTSSCRDAITTRDVSRLAIASASVQVLGLACASHVTGNSEYTLQPETINMRAHYITADGTRHLYWTDGMWVLDSDADGAAYSAYINSDAMLVPSGTAQSWKEHCNRTWEFLPIDITEQLTPANCAARANDQTAQIICRGANSAICPLSCADAWVNVAQSCSTEQDAFDEAIPEGFTALCQDTIDAALSTAANIIQVSGMSCHEAGNAEYVLQTSTKHGKVIYATEDGARYLYWTPRHGGYWILDSNMADDAFSAYYISVSSLVPAGRHSWFEHCGSWGSLTIEVTETLSQSNCVSISAHVLGSSACRLHQETISSCLDTPSVVCKLACAELWLTALIRCDSNQILRQAFDDDAGEMTDACTQTMEAAIATAPSRVQVLSLFITMLIIYVQVIVYAPY